MQPRLLLLLGLGGGSRLLHVFGAVQPPAAPSLHSHTHPPISVQYPMHTSTSSPVCAVHTRVHSRAKLCPCTKDRALQEEGKPESRGGSKAAAPRLPPAKGERARCGRGVRVPRLIPCLPWGRVGAGVPSAGSWPAPGAARRSPNCVVLTQLGQPARARPRPADVLGRCPRSPAGSTSPAHRPPASRRRGGHEPAATEPQPRRLASIPRARCGRASVSPPAAASFPRGFPPPRGR